MNTDRRVGGRRAKRMERIEQRKGESRSEKENKVGQKGREKRRMDKKRAKK